MRMLRLAKLGAIWERIEARIGSIFFVQCVALIRALVERRDVGETFAKPKKNGGVHLVGGLEHFYTFFIFHFIYGTILPIDELIFFKMVKTC